MSSEFLRPYTRIFDDVVSGMEKPGVPVSNSLFSNTGQFTHNLIEFISQLSQNFVNGNIGIAIACESGADFLPVFHPVLNEAYNIHEFKAYLPSSTNNYNLNALANEYASALPCTSLILHSLTAETFSNVRSLRIVSQKKEGQMDQRSRRWPTIRTKIVEERRTSQSTMSALFYEVYVDSTMSALFYDVYVQFSTMSALFYDV
ncbi:hypothetical protein GCK72_000499 [Caenorhabditis remanei]|uniref:Uncharacterized protein n=1 Tax=Caenorhabditis remanei TaxID=31234 RepID=A0A6A5HPT9_CAERE|nr:hypothetical protein GCK72_000499 [Caenorhabditis remanei]KAF1768686.1 hypothetical protein GCK72_000499 [Caenorhabditis remanei]